MKYSVIVPCYNCEHTIINSVNSCLKYMKDRKDIELILVNDGSTDSTAQILNTISQNDKRIKIVNKQNGGPSSSRNMGIEKATGKYILFLDSDDEFIDDVFSIEPDNNNDVLIFGFYQNIIPARCKIDYIPFSDSLNYLYSNNFLNPVWNKIYSRDFLISNNIRFSDMMYGEDRIFNADIIEAGANISILNKIYYNYIIRDNLSLTSKYLPEKFEDILIIYERYKNILGNTDELRFGLIKGIISTAVVMIGGDEKFSDEKIKRNIGEIISDPIVMSAFSDKIGGDSYREILRKVICSGNALLNFCMMKAIYFIKKYFYSVYLKYRK